MTLRESITTLDAFSELESIRTLIPDLESFNLKPPEMIDESLVHSVRKKLTALLCKTEIVKEGHSLAEAAFSTLLTLAILKPLNTEDPITKDDISAEDKVYISTGHCFSISTLIAFHNGRAPRNNLNEKSDAKWLMNPFTNNKCSTLDTQHIEAIAIKKGIIIAHLKSHCSRPSHSSFMSDQTSRRFTTNPVSRAPTAEVMATLSPLTLGLHFTILVLFLNRIFNGRTPNTASSLGTRSP